MEYRLSISIIALLCTVNFAFAGEIWVSVTGNDKHAGTREMPLRTVAQALKQAREWRRLSDPAVERGINIRLERGIYPQDEILFLRPEDSGTEDSPTVIEAVEPGKTKRGA